MGTPYTALRCWPHNITRVFMRVKLGFLIICMRNMRNKVNTMYLDEPCLLITVYRVLLPFPVFYLHHTFMIKFSYLSCSIRKQYFMIFWPKRLICMKTWWVKNDWTRSQMNEKLYSDRICLSGCNIYLFYSITRFPSNKTQIQTAIKLALGERVSGELYFLWTWMFADVHTVSSLNI